MTPLTFAEYQALPALNVSLLKELRRSPAHFLHARRNPREETAAMALGTATHCAVLEPDRFRRDYAVWSQRTESGRLSPRSGKAWEAFVAANAGRQIITWDDALTAMAMQAAVRDDPVAGKYLHSGEAEVTLKWTLGERPCKGRVDWLTRQDGEPVIVGLKTSRDCRHFPFSAQAARLGYHLQWAWYFDGYLTATGERPRMVELVVESSAPHVVVAYVIDDHILDQGRDEYLALLERLDRCEREDRWPGPADTELVLSLPDWAYPSEDLGDGETLNWEGVA